MHRFSIRDFMCERALGRQLLQTLDLDLNIPQRIHFIWLGSAAKEQHKSNIASWQQQNPEYELHLWIDSGIFPLELMKVTKDQIIEYCAANRLILHDLADPQYAQWVAKPCYADRVNGEDKMLAYAADYLRLKILEMCGGIYSDVDVVCHKSLGQLANKYGFFGLCEGPPNDNRITDTWFIAAVANNVIIKACLDKIEANYIKFIINGYSVDEYKSGIKLDRVCFLDREQERKRMNIAYGNFRFKSIYTTANISRYLCGNLSISTFNNFAATLCAKDFNVILFKSDGILFNQNDSSWRRPPRHLPGIRGVTIIGADTEVIFDAGRRYLDISVSREALEQELNNQRTQPGSRTNERLVALLAPNRLVARLYGV